MKRVVDVLVVAVGVVHAGRQEGRVLVCQREAGVGGKRAVVVDPGLVALQSLGRLVVEEDQIVANVGARCVLVDIERGQYGSLAQVFVGPRGQRYGELSQAVPLDGDRLRRDVHEFLLGFAVGQHPQQHHPHISAHYNQQIIINPTEPAKAD